MDRISASLVILACDRVEHVERLLESFEKFKNISFQVVIGDNSTCEKSSLVFKSLADTYIPIPDYDLWHEGFGPTKQRLLNAADRDLCFIADSDEVWRPIVGSEKLIESDDWVALKVRLFDDLSTAPIDQCRICKKSKMRFRGIIHEELFSKESTEHWVKKCGNLYLANVYQFREYEPSQYSERKKALYDNLIWRAAHENSPAPTLNSYWRSSYIGVLERRNFEPMTFEEWSSKFGGNLWSKQ